MKYVISILKERIEQNKTNIRLYEDLADDKKHSELVRESYQYSVNALSKNNEEIKSAIKKLKSQ